LPRLAYRKELAVGEAGLKTHGFASPPFDGFAIIGFDVVNVQCRNFIMVTSFSVKGSQADNDHRYSCRISFVMSECSVNGAFEWE
jgi:hypothetical protein